MSVDLVNENCEHYYNRDVDIVESYIDFYIFTWTFFILHLVVHIARPNFPFFLEQKIISRFSLWLEDNKHIN